MTMEIIWKELNCPLLNGALCERSACMASSCGETYPLFLYDRVETEEREVEEITVDHEGWWIFRKRVETKSVSKKTFTRLHYSKKLIRSYVTCSHHNNNNIGVKIEVRDIDEYGGWLGKYSGWINPDYNHDASAETLQAQIQEARDSINRDCIYDTME